MTLAMPVAVLPTKFTGQLPAARIQLVALNEPPVVPADSVMVPVKAPRLVRLIIVELPAHDVIVSEVGLAEMVKSLTIRLAVPELAK